MNYLGHIYFSGNNLQLAKANLFGDSVKGSDYTRFPDFIQAGIKLHREIDNYIDHHPSVMNLVRALRVDLPKVAPIAVDLYFDHLLAKNWSDFHSTPINEYLHTVHTEIDKIDNEHYPMDFNDFIDKLCHYQWMTHYSSIDGLDKMCNGVSRRLSFPNALPNGMQVFKNHTTVIENAFNEYMRDANEHFLNTF